MIQPPGEEPALPGNAQGIVTECDRLRALADHLDQTGRALRDVRVESWAGPARERFDAAQYELSKRWRQSADAHYAAADALSEYQVTLENLQQLAKSELADAADDPVRLAAAAELVQRWRAQQDEAGRRAARAILRAGEDLVTLPPVLPNDAAPPPPAPPVAPARRPEPVAEPVPDAPPPLDPLRPEAAHDWNAYEGELARLNQEVRAAWTDPDRLVVVPLP